MEDINRFVGDRIHFFRKMRGYTLQALADTIGKSKSTVSKYEKSEIAIDLQVLFEIAQALGVPVSRFIDFPEQGSIQRSGKTHSLFASANTLYLYFYDAPSARVIESIIRIQPGEENVQASLYFDLPASNFNYHNCRSFYQGQVEYHTSTINFVLENQFNDAEKMFLSFYHPIDREQETPGLLCGLTRQRFQPAAVRCLLSLRRLKADDTLIERLQLSRRELQEIRKSNMLIIENRLIPEDP